MKHILSILIFLSFMSVANAEVGDSYYCESSNILKVTPDKVEVLAEERFTFKRSKSEKLYFMEQEGFFKNRAIYSVRSDTRSKEWFYSSNGGIFDYKDGVFAYIERETFKKEVSIIIANCNILR